MSSWIVLDRNYAELKLSDGRLHHLREEMYKMAKQWGIDEKSPVISFLSYFYGSTSIDIVDELIEKSEIELFGKLFLATIEKVDSEGEFNYFEVPDDPELRSFYYSMMRICFEPMNCCEDCLLQVNEERFIEKTGGIFKKILEVQNIMHLQIKFLNMQRNLKIKQWAPQ